MLRGRGLPNRPLRRIRDGFQTRVAAQCSAGWTSAQSLSSWTDTSLRNPCTTHSGFEQLQRLADAPASVPLQHAIRVEITCVPRTEIPSGPRFVEWRDGQWSEHHRQLTDPVPGNSSRVSIAVGKPFAAAPLLTLGERLGDSAALKRVDGRLWVAVVATAALLAALTPSSARADLPQPELASQVVPDPVAVVARCRRQSSLSSPGTRPGSRRRSARREGSWR